MEPPGLGSGADTPSHRIESGINRLLDEADDLPPSAGGWGASARSLRAPPGLDAGPRRSSASSSAGSRSRSAEGPSISLLEAISPSAAQSAKHVQPQPQARAARSASAAPRLVASSVHEMGLGTFFSVSIDKTSTATDAGTQFTMFHIAVGTGLRSWTVNRRYRQFLALHNGLLRAFPEVELPRLPAKKIFGSSLRPEFVEDRRAGLNAYLKALVGIRDVWQHRELIQFLDDASSSLTLQVQFGRVVDHVAVLERICRETQQELLQTRETARAQAEQLSALQRRMAALEGRSVSADSSSAHHVSAPVPVPVAAAAPPDTSTPLSVSAAAAAVGSAMPAPETAGWEDPQEVSDESSDEEEARASAPVGGTFGLHVAAELQSPLPSENAPPSPMYRPSGAGSNPWGSPGLVFMSSGAAAQEQAAGAIADDLIPTNGVHEPLSVDVRVAELVELLQPHPGAHAHRARVFYFIAGLVRKALGAPAFPVGNYAYSCYLPDEEMGLSAFLCMGQETSWFIKLNEVLCVASGSALPSGASSASASASASEEATSPRARRASLDDVDALRSLVEEHGTGFSVSNVNFVNAEQKRVKCLVDNVAVDVSANQITDMCEAAFFEEADQLIGKAHLFKRSLLLIKAWCAYESRSFAGKSALLSLSELALSTLVLYVFNAHHEQLSHPLQALARFFHLFTGFDWAMHTLSLDGVRLTSSMEFLSRVDNPVVPAETLRRFRQRYQRVSAPDEPRPSDDGGDADANANGNANAEPAQLLVEQPDPDRFERSGLNVLNPLHPALNLGTAMTPRRARRVAQLFQLGARTLKPVLQHIQRGSAAGANAPGGGTARALLDAMFSNSWQRFGSGWRPDCLTRVEVSAGPASPSAAGRASLGGSTSPVPPLGPPLLAADEVQLLEDASPPAADAWSEVYNKMSDAVLMGGSPGTSPRAGAAPVSPAAAAAVHDSDGGDDSDPDDPAAVVDPLGANAQQLWQNLEYGALLLDSEITAPALIALATEVLASRHPLPVGEIGKMLQEATANLSLSARLKEKYGGLKKFLEGYPEVFLIGSDHPFNPHVHLRSLLSPEDVRRVQRGEQLHPAGAPGSAKKKKQSRRRTGSTATPKRRGGGGSSPTGRGGGGGGANPSARPFVPGTGYGRPTI